MVALDDEGAPQYLLEFLWIMLKYSVQTLCNILGGALCEKKKKKKKIKLAEKCCLIFSRELCLKCDRAPRSDFETDKFRLRK